MAAEDTTSFLNVDLELRSASDLAPLVKALTRSTLPLHVGRLRRSYRARLCLRRQPKSPSDAIQGFIRAVSKLSPNHKTAWKRASLREFDVGIQAGLEPRLSEWALDALTLRQVAVLGGQVRLTLYSPLFGQDISPEPEQPPNDALQRTRPAATKPRR